MIRRLPHFEKARAVPQRAMKTDKDRPALSCVNQEGLEFEIRGGIDEGKRSAKSSCRIAVTPAGRPAALPLPDGWYFHWAGNSQFLHFVLQGGALHAELLFLKGIYPKVRKARTKLSIVSCRGACSGQYAPIGHHQRCVSPAANATQLYQRAASLVILYWLCLRLLKSDSSRADIYKYPFSCAHCNHDSVILCTSPRSSGLVGSSSVMACKAQNQ